MNTANILARNLARFRRRNRALARAIEKVSPEGAEIRIGPRGARTVARDGVLLASAYDPEGEGQRLAEEMHREPADILVALGFGLGHHLEAYRRLNPCPMIVYEPSLASLRAALSARKALTLLEAADVHLVGELDELDRALAALYTPGLRIRIYPHPALLRLDRERVAAAVTRARRIKDTIDVNTGTQVADLRTWTALSARNAGRIAGTTPFSELAGRFGKLPVVVVAAGPSLTKQLPVLAEFRDRVGIICIGQAVGALRAAGIEPDLVHVIESQPVAHQLERGGSSRNLDLVVTPDVDPSLFEVPVRTRFLAYPMADQIGHWIGAALGETRWVMGGGTVAHGAIGLAAAMDASPVILIGQDLAFTDGEAYATGSAYDGVGVSISERGTFRVTNNDSRRELLGMAPAEDAEQEVLWVEGWSGGRVPTSKAYMSFIEHYRGVQLLLERAGIRLVNCTEGGARLPRVEHAPFRGLLEECARKPVVLRDRIRELHDAWSPVGPEVLERAVDEARDSLRGIEKLAAASLHNAENSGREIALARGPDRQIQILRRIGRSERDLRKRLEVLPWLDALVQPELYASLANHRRKSAGPPTPGEAIAEASFLCRATVTACRRAHGILEQILEGIDEAG